MEFKYATNQVHIQLRPVLISKRVVPQNIIERLIRFFLSSQVNCKDIARRFLDWMKRGIPELGDYVGMGIGATTDRVIHHKSFLEDPMAVSLRRYMNRPEA